MVNFMVNSVCEPTQQFLELLSIMQKLRSPEGCPWDRAQTHESIRSNMIEECYEAVEAIDTRDSALLREELGDVLLQVVFHAQIAAEEGTFSISDVLSELCGKLIARHEHVFGSHKANDADDALDRWEQAKRKTKSETTDAERLRAVPAALPALMRASKVQARAAKAGFPLSDSGMGQAGEPAGKALWDLVLSLRASGIDPEQALNRYTNDFILSFSDWENSR